MTDQASPWNSSAEIPNIAASDRDGRDRLPAIRASIARSDAIWKSNGGFFFDHDPDIFARDHPPIWSPVLSPSTVPLATAAEGPTWPAPFPIPVDSIADILERPHDETRGLVIRDRDGDHYLCLTGPDSLRRPAALLPIDDALALRVESLMRLQRRLEGRPTGPPPRLLQITPMRRTRLILQLHALDFEQNGTAPRQIAAAMLDRAAATMRAIEWKSSALRRRTMRLLEDARAMRDGSYRQLLKGH